MMENYYESVEINHSPNWTYFPAHSFRILIISGSGSDKINVLLNLLKQWPDIDKIYLYVKSIWVKGSIAYQRKRKKKLKNENSKSIYWLFTNS